MKDFFTGSAEAQGAFSWQHLTFVTFLMLVMAFLAIFFGRRKVGAHDLLVELGHFSAQRNTAVTKAGEEII